MVQPKWQTTSYYYCHVKVSVLSKAIPSHQPQSVDHVCDGWPPVTYVVKHQEVRLEPAPIGSALQKQSHGLQAIGQSPTVH